MALHELHLPWAARLAIQHGIRATERKTTRVLDTLFPITDTIRRQRKALIHYRHTPRFRDPIHGLHTDDSPVPSLREIAIAKRFNTIERRLEFIFEELPGKVYERTRSLLFWKDHALEQPESI